MSKKQTIVHGAKPAKGSPNAKRLAYALERIRHLSRGEMLAVDEVTRIKAVAASAYQVLNLALQEPKDSAMTAHLVHVATVALGTIED